MAKILFIILTFLIIGCNANKSLVDEHKYDFEPISFDAVQKNLIIQANLPDYVKKLLFQWFDEKIKINGFTGELRVIITDYEQKIYLIENGKKVEAILNYQIILNKSSDSKSDSLSGYISSYGSLTGSFSLIDFETVIKNTQVKLIYDLNKYLKEKLNN